MQTIAERRWFLCQLGAEFGRNWRMTICAQHSGITSSILPPVTAKAEDGSGVEATCTVTVRKKSSGGGSSPSYYYIYFDTNGGEKMEAVSKLQNEVIDLSDYIPKKEGYKFLGWYSNGNFDKLVDKVELTYDTTVFAKWEKIEEEEKEPEETKESGDNTFTDVNDNDWYFDSVNYVVEKGIMNGLDNNTFGPNIPLSREMLAVVLYNMEDKPLSMGVNKFTDVKEGLWYTDAIIWASENNIVAGNAKDFFGIGERITREQFAAILYRYAQYKGYDTTQGGMAIREFSDYELISDYAKPSMAWAVNTGIIGGMGDGTVLPKGKATRAEAATMLMNFCENIVE